MIGRDDTTRRPSTALTVALAAFAALAASTAPAGADTFVVTKRGDPAPDRCKKRDCSLREAVRAAHDRLGRDVIELPNRRKPYNLSIGGTDEDLGLVGDLDILNDPLVIKHPGKGRATIDANGIDRVFDVHPAAPTRFRKLVIQGGDGGFFGGGIRSAVRVEAILSRIAGNEANNAGGIALKSGAELKLVRTVVARNEAVALGGQGGGISNVPNNEPGEIEVLRSRIVRNAAHNGGGLHFASDESSRIVDSTIAGNTAVAQGGGVAVGTDPDIETLRFRGTTISGNRAGSGGGVNAFGPVKLINSTVASNRATGNAGGMFVSGGGALNAVTLARNVADADDDGFGVGGGLYLADPEFQVGNSLIGLNRLGSGGRNDCAGNHPAASLGHNLLSTRGPAGACEGFDRPTDRVRRNPRIGKLKRNGGPTRTIALRRRSPAINKAKRATAPNRDQRGKRRGRKKDIGAYERNTGR